jgi:hypothetical protein
MASHGVDAIACRPSAASLLTYAARSGANMGNQTRSGAEAPRLGGSAARQSRTDRRKCAHTAVGLVALLIGEGVELGEVVDILGAVLVPEIVEAALLAC